MTNTSSLYWLTRLDNIQDLFTTFLVVGIIGLFILGAIKFHNYMEENTPAKRPGLTALAITFICLGALGQTFTPTTKEAIFIVAGGKTLDYVSSDTALKKIPGQLSGITSSWLETKLKEIETDLTTDTKK